MNSPERPSESSAESLRALMDDDFDGRLCEDISESACRETSRSFLLTLISQGLGKLADALASPKTTLPWLVTAVGAPAFVLGFLVPLRESGSMIPQMLIGGYIRSFAVRKWFFVLGNLIQGACLAALGWVAVMGGGRSAGWTILGLVAVFSLARSLSSIASKDVMGKTITRRRRGRLSGWAASVAGFLSISVGLYLGQLPDDAWDGGVLALLMLASAAGFVLAGLVFAFIPEERGETGGGRSALQSLQRLSLLKKDRDFRRFVTARALLMCSALSAPFYVALAQGAGNGGLAALGAFVVAAGLASLLSGPFWGRFADRSSRQVMSWAAWVTAASGLLVAAVSWARPELLATAWFVPGAYFMLSIAHEGVRVGRKTYVVNLGSGNLRTDYVAISNSVIGVLLLVVGSVGALAVWLGNAGVIALLASMGLLGALLSASLKEV